MKSRVYFGFDFFLDLEAYIELDPITTYRSMPHACALKPHPHLPCETPLILPEFFSFLSFLFLFSSFFESVIKVPLHFRSSFLCLFYIYFFLFWFFRFLFFLSFLPFAFFLLSFFRSFCSFCFLSVARGWRTLRAHSKCFPLAERIHCTPTSSTDSSWQIFWDRGIFRHLEIMIILCYCWIEWKGM